MIACGNSIPAATRSQTVDAQTNELDKSPRIVCMVHNCLYVKDGCFD